MRDSTFPELISSGRLSELEELQIEKSANLSLATLDALITGCPELRSVGDLSQWMLDDENYVEIEAKSCTENYDENGDESDDDVRDNEGEDGIVDEKNSGQWVI